MESKKTVSRITKLFILIDDIVHIIVAILLVGAAFLLLYEAGLKFREANEHAAFQMISDLLFVLVIMEFLWSIIRYLKRLPFSIEPFLYVGIISSIRGMVVVEAKLATGSGKEILYFQLAEICVAALVVFIFVLSLYLLRKTPPASLDE
ncbi:phosphate-starvation-inducible PsiE family protein [bacterium]|nr:phosphate-starvation-inducible PsiE family protein [bacterium]MBU2461986.1 phosphate-starvation-inducible PsiE family protein [bacterium]